MRKSIYIQLVLIFLCIFFISNIVASTLTSLNAEQDLLYQVKDQLIQEAEIAKEFYEKEDISKGNIEKLFKDKYITINFRESVTDYNMDKELELLLNSGETILFHKKGPKLFSFTPPLSIVKSGDYYIVAEPIFKNMGINVWNFITTMNIIAIIIGIILFLFAGKMIVKPIKRLTDATEKVVTGDFDIKLTSNRKDEIGTLISSFNMMANELKSIEILRNDFISDVSHEFKTPLTSIEGYTKLLKECDEEERDEYIDIITEETSRLSKLATNILTLNKIESDSITIFKEEFSLDEQIRRAILLLENQWSEKEIQLEIDLENIKYKGNSDLMYQVWINLIDNAIKFSPKGEILKIELNKDEKEIKFSIQDFGDGVDKENETRIFEKFYKSDKSRNTTGNGLGLSIVKRIIDIHNGRIYLDLKIEKGTKVIVEL